MKYRAGQRLKAVRELAGIEQEDFATFLDIEYTRLCNVEYMRSKMNEDDFYSLSHKLPELMSFIAGEQPIMLEQLLNSPSQFVQMIGLRIGQGLQPKVFNIKEFIK